MLLYCLIREKCWISMLDTPFTCGSFYHHLNGTQEKYGPSHPVSKQIINTESELSCFVMIMIEGM